jgi:anhydro-N-acetylmuramic acid kinase
MNANLKSLYQIGQKPIRHIIGLMSGTSLDGLDVALCAVSGDGENTKVKILQFQTVEYTDEIKIHIRQVFAKKMIDFQHLALLNEWIGQLHARMILQCLQVWNISPSAIDLIASHGQTVMHAPKALHKQAQFGNATLQIGDGDHIAVATGIITISDFRQKHIAAGGEGAPLAVYGDYYIFSKRDENRIMLNMGGIANFTYLPGNLEAQDVFVTDTGTGNTLLDAFTRQHFPSMAFDQDANIAKQGRLSEPLLQALMSDPFFKQSFPKTTGPELFNLAYLQAAQTASGTLQLSTPDVMATLTQFSATTIAQAIKQCIGPANSGASAFKIYMSGGGAHNPLLVDLLKAQLPCEFYTTDDLGISGDAKEAVLFAILANETVAGGKSNFGERKGIPSVAMGKISFPS